VNYQKWLGASLGWVVTGSPVGAVLGFGAGKLMEKDKKTAKDRLHTSDFEVNILLLASSVIHAEKGVTFRELEFIRDFWKTNFSEEHLDEKMNVLNHFLQKKYDAKKACVDLYNGCTQTVIYQIVHFLFDVATCDKPISEKERDAIFILCCWMNVNDVDFLKIEASRSPQPLTVYDILEVKETDSITVIRSRYRKLILQFHPDKHIDASEAERKRLEKKIRQIKEAYEQIKRERA